MKRANGKRHYVLLEGHYYVNAGGGCYYCEERLEDDIYIMVNAASGWRFKAHVITKYDDDSIEWDYSTEGSWS